MKTLKEVVEEVGLPVYVKTEFTYNGIGNFSQEGIINLIEEEIVYTANDGFLTGEEYHNAPGGWYGGSKVSFYQGLNNESELTKTLITDSSDKSSVLCICQTLLNGHHNGCGLWKP